MKPRKTGSLKSGSLPPIKVRREPPTLDEAVAAAQGLADDVESQVAIAAGLMGLSEDEVRPSVLSAEALRRAAPAKLALPERAVADGPRRPVVVVVERRGAGRAQRPAVREIARR